MRENRCKAMARAGQPAIGTMQNAASPLMAEWLGHSGYDFVVIDLQHGENNLGTVSSLLQAMSSTPATPIVRVPSKDGMAIQRVLDLGAYGIIVPQVDTRADAEAVVRNVRYAPNGERSWGPIRGAIYGGPDYFSAAARELLVLPMIESRTGLANAREILAVDGIDGCFVGPGDLGVTLGESPEDIPKLLKNVDQPVGQLAEIARAAGKIAGIHAFDHDDAKRRLAQGYTFMTVMADTRLVRAGAATTLSLLRTA
jgi:4-hydroxy-2-oxoheptanedioate aldolase